MIWLRSAKHALKLSYEFQTSPLDVSAALRNLALKLELEHFFNYVLTLEYEHYDIFAYFFNQPGDRDTIRLQYYYRDLYILSLSTPKHYLHTVTIYKWKTLSLALLVDITLSSIKPHKACE